MILLRINWNLKLGRRAVDDRRKQLIWQQQRVELFNRYTLPSLVNQTVQDWQAWLRCDPELLHLTESMSFADPRVQIVYDTKKEIQKIQEKRPSKLIFARIDSDDVLHPEALSQWQQQEQGLFQLGFGYALCIQSGDMWEWNHPSSPFIARVGDWRMLNKGLPSLGGSHGKVYRTATRIEGGRWYIVILHTSNICNGLSSPWIGQKLSPHQKADVLNMFRIL